MIPYPSKKPARQPMEPTQVRRRPAATRKRSRSTLPRIDTYEFVQRSAFYEERESSSFTSVLVRFFRSLLVLTLTSVAFLSIAIWTHRLWLPRACDRFAIQNASSALSRVVEIDICSTPLDELPRSICDLAAVKDATHSLSRLITVDICNPSPAGDVASQPSDDDEPPAEQEQESQPSRTSALDLVQHMREIGDTIQGLEDSYHDISYLQSMQTRNQNFPLQRAKSDDTADNARKRTLRNDLAHNIEKYVRFLQDDLRPAVHSTKQRFREIGAMVHRRVSSALKYQTRRCAFYERWLPASLLDVWVPRSTSAVALLEILDKSAASLVPELGLVHQSSERLLEGLERLSSRLHDDERKSPASGVDDETLIGELESYGMDLHPLARSTNDVHTQTLELGRALWDLREMVRTRRCLEFSPEDEEVLEWQLAGLQSSMETMARSRM